MSATIKVNKSALFEMVLAAFEAYAVKHQEQKSVSIETFAHLWGTINKSHPFKCTIEHVSVETSANRDSGSVSPVMSSLEIKKDVAQAFGFGYSYIGSFHTHPWLRDEVYGEDFYGEKLRLNNTNTIRKRKFYNFSDSDHIAEVDNPEIRIANKNYSVALVLTIHAAEKADDRKDGRIDSSLVEFSLGNVKMWLKAQVFEHKKTDELSDEDKKNLDIYDLTHHNNFNSNSETMPIPVNTFLDCEASFYLKKFGRLSINESSSNYSNSELSEKRWFNV
ncbi:hypothetical protein [Pseudoalteromonas sp. SG44-8]|uniref:hypothetical protein n=1 Tax=Pseudoalteromonas sp. SG44-8 TaxID=2760958 RepID=UPI00160358AC|nr:hypothetical protein [Pseudoalteromonas sp. SG44-8]MBB1398080.1 hypothetical protein [Pseudoalteromonas sp. SG44-8]